MTNAVARRSICRHTCIQKALTPMKMSSPSTDAIYESDAILNSCKH